MPRCALAQNVGWAGGWPAPRRQLRRAVTATGTHLQCRSHNHCGGVKQAGDCAHVDPAAAVAAGCCCSAAAAAEMASAAVNGCCRWLND
jgi:hypothetical protein